MIAAVIFGPSILGQTKEQAAENARQEQLARQYGGCGSQLFHVDYNSSTYKRLEREVAHDLLKFRDKDLNVIPLSQWSEKDRQAHADLALKLLSAKGKYNVAVANYNRYMEEAGFPCSSAEQLPAGQTYLYPRKLDFVSTN